ncbi:hypothetical protein WMY93_014530 [Mugilogobius chulae]|uniref:Uncharacterized protein n=1 Tax=Mugilogobius chulae TaxID=88201 RepID=A0AAW0NZA0_9GOBI
MLDNKVPRLKVGPSPKATSFFIENLLGTSAEKREAREESARYKGVGNSAEPNRDKDSKSLNERGLYEASPGARETRTSPLFLDSEDGDRESPSTGQAEDSDSPEEKEDRNDGEEDERTGDAKMARKEEDTYSVQPQPSIPARVDL